MTIKLIAFGLAAAPLGAHATVLYVEYEGTVDFVDTRCWCGDTGYSPGDFVKGLLKVDTDLAPPDGFAENPNRGQYYAALFDGRDFISGPIGGPHLPRSEDFVGVENRPPNLPGRYDGYVVNDKSSTRPGTAEVWIEAYSYTRDLVSGDGLVQQLDVMPSEDTHLIGWIRRQVGAFSHRVWLNLARVSVTPGRCRAG